MKKFGSVFWCETFEAGDGQERSKSQDIEPERAILVENLAQVTSAAFFKTIGTFPPSRPPVGERRRLFKTDLVKQEGCSGGNEQGWQVKRGNLLAQLQHVIIAFGSPADCVEFYQSSSSPQI